MEPKCQMDHIPLSKGWGWYFQTLIFLSLPWFGSTDIGTREMKKEKVFLYRLVG